MGTSSSSRGPKGSGGLLPPWAEPPPDLSPLSPDSRIPDSSLPADVTPPPVKPSPAPSDLNRQPIIIPPIRDTSWTSVKTRFSNYANNPSSGRLGRVFRSYVRAGGGSKGTVSASRSGRASTYKLAFVLSSINRDGIVQTAKKFGIGDIKDKNLNVVIASFIELIAPPGALIEESIARKAMIQTVSDIFDALNIEEKGIEVFDKMSSEDIRDFIGISITNYINERFQHELAYRIEKSEIDPTVAFKLSNEIKAYIRANTDTAFKRLNPEKIDWSSKEGQAVIKDLYEKAFSLLGNE